MIQKTVAAIVGAWAGAVARQWVLRRGLGLWLANLIAGCVGSTVSAAVARV